MFVGIMNLRIFRISSSNYAVKTVDKFCQLFKNIKPAVDTVGVLREFRSGNFA